jgi:two-component system OmpR family sensor kinase
MLARMSLRARLVLGVIVLALVGLAAADAVTYTSLRSLLFDRTDNSLDAASLAVGQALGGGPQQPRPQGSSRLGVTAVGDFVQVRRPDGSILATVRATKPGQVSALPNPRLPASALSATEGAQAPGAARYLTVGAVRGGGRYQLRISVDPRTNFTVIVGAPLGNVDSTLSRLVLIEVLVTAAVLIALSALGLSVVRLGLRPLRKIEETAAAIAGGDLSRRIARADKRTEVGRLGLALNSMLGQIEAAFREREESERKLRRFIADASHELRTPLAAVRAYAELFGRGAEKRPKDLARAMTGIGRESERMSALVSDLLLLARINEGRPLARERVQLERVLEEAVETARAVEPKRPIELKSTPAVVRGDTDRLRQVIDNLLSNARAHTPAEAPVRVSLKTGHGRVQVEVADSGPGLSADEAEHVFERFYRTDKSRSRKSGGTGLGLSIVKAVVEAHGGTVSARSRPGKGARFAFELPLAGTDTAA